jgi:UDPglucose 6-dehydrogenase/GDP-mannose 6-dehydrogenase
MTRVAIVGTGYVGLVTGAGLATLGHEVVCVDLLSERVAQINAGVVPFHEAGLQELLADAVKNGSLSATTSLADAMQGAEVSIIAVGTPAKDDGIDLSYVANAASEIGALLDVAAPYHVVVVKSTVVPGTTDTLVRSRVSAASGRTSEQFGLCMNPEFLREGSAVDDFVVPDRIVIGQGDSRAGEVVATLYVSFDCPIVRTTLRNAEMIKYASNALLASLISFSNEIAGLCECLPECDVDTVMDAVQLDRRLAPMVDGSRIRPGVLAYLRAGSGYGGSCFPKDLFALRMFAREVDAPTPLLDAVTEVNRRRPEMVVARLTQLIGPLRSRTVAVIGLAFKPGTDDLRCSPALEIISRLCKEGVCVHAYDPVAMSVAARLPNRQFAMRETPEELVADADAVIIATGWPEIAHWDWERLATRMRGPWVIDARNACRKTPWPASIRYVPIGVAIENGFPAQGSGEPTDRIRQGSM